MNLDDIRGFIAVADTLHVGAAADALGISQSALTRRVQRVEQAVRADLFDRSGRQLALNARGEAFLPHAHALLASWQAGADSVARLMDPERGTVRLDFMHSLGTWMVPDLLRGYRAEHPHVDIQLHQGAARELVDRVRSGHADLALVGPRPDAPDLGWHQLELQRLAVGVPEGHWAAGRPSVAMADLADETFIGMLPGYGTRMLLDALAAEAGFAPRLIFESMELTTVAGLVTAGLGCALLPLDDPYLGAENLVPIDPPRYRELGLVWKPGSPAPPVDQFREFVMA